MLFIIAGAVFLAAVGTAIAYRNQLTAYPVTGGAILVAVVALVVMLVSCLTIVPAGMVGVRDVFGDVADQHLGSGLQFVNPLATIRRFSVQSKKRDEKVLVPSSEGVIVTLDVTVQYKLIPAKAPEVFKTVGSDQYYQEVILIPPIRSTLRNVISGHKASDLYSVKRGVISEEIKAKLTKSLLPRGLIIEDILLRDVVLPATLTKAIERKLAAVQEVKTQEFKIASKKQEAQQVIETAKGKAKSQEIINSTLTSAYLQWLWIDALSRNPNVIYVATEANIPLFKAVDPPRKKPMLPVKDTGSE